MRRKSLFLMWERRPAAITGAHLGVTHDRGEAPLSQVINHRGEAPLPQVIYVPLMYQNILIPVDVAVASSWRKPLPAAIDHRRHFPAAVLHLVAVVPELPPQLAFLPEEYTARMVALATEKLAAIVRDKIPRDIPVRQYIRQGCVFREILKTAAEVNADLIIMGPHQPEFEDYLLGPNASRVVRHAACSVLIVR